MKRDREIVTAKTYSDECPLDVAGLPCTVISNDEGRIERAYRIINAVWQRISAPDQARMLEAISTWSNTQVVLVIHNDWNRSMDTNAQITTGSHGAFIEMETGYFDAAENENVMTTMAHELGHLFGFLDDDLSEETAHQYQYKWGFSDGMVVFKDEACRYIDSVLEKEGIPGEVFWQPSWQHYFYLRGGARLTLKSAEMYIMFEHPWSTLEGLLMGYWPDDLPEIIKRAALADDLGKTERIAEYERNLTRIDEVCAYWRDEDMAI
jgi:hypothetical protein